MKITLPDAELELSLRASLSDEQLAELMADDMPAEYNIDHSQAKPNRFARRGNMLDTVKLDADVAAADRSIRLPKPRKCPVDQAVYDHDS